MCCAVVLSDSAASLIGYVASTATAKTTAKTAGTATGVQEWPAHIQSIVSRHLPPERMS